MGKTRLVLPLAAAATALAALFYLAEVKPNTALLWLLNPPPPRDQVIVVAHRGASAEAPENTMAAFRRAVELGADGVEFDMVWTRDDVPVVSHHYDLSSRVGAPTRLEEIDWSEATRLDVGSWFGPQFAGERIPTLEEALAYLHRRVRRVYVHDKWENDYAGPKRARIARAAQIIEATGMAEVVAVMVESCDDEAWRELAPQIATLRCWISPTADNGHVAVEQARSDARHIGVYHRSDQLAFPFNRLAHFHALRDTSTALGFWPRGDVLARFPAAEFVVFTLNDPLLMRLYLDAGFHAIGTDDPRLLLSLLSRGG